MINKGFLKNITLCVKEIEKEAVVVARGETIEITLPMEEYEPFEFIQLNGPDYLKSLKGVCANEKNWRDNNEGEHFGDFLLGDPEIQMSFNQYKERYYRSLDFLVTLKEKLISMFEKKYPVSKALRDKLRSQEHSLTPSCVIDNGNVCLNDTEQRIFLAAIGREMKVAEDGDRENPNAPVPLVPVVNSICKKIMGKTYYQIVGK